MLHVRATLHHRCYSQYVAWLLQHTEDEALAMIRSALQDYVTTVAVCRGRCGVVRASLMDCRTAERKSMRWCTL